MTIQISITLWTIICFVLLMLILHNLLFKPVLRVMDARREKIENAAAKKAEWERTEQEHSAMLIEMKEKATAENQRLIKENVEIIRQESKKTVELAKDARLRLVDEYREYIDKEHSAILSSLSEHKSDLAKAFSDRLTKG